MQYYNLDLTIERPVDGRHRVKARSETQGEAEGLLGFDPASAEIVGACARLVRVGADAGPVRGELLQGFGATLWEGLFCGAVRDLYRSCLGEVQRDDRTGVRIRLGTEAASVAVLPWELLYDPARETFLATSIETPLTRYINLHEPIRNLRTMLPVRVLIVIPGASGLDVGAERETMTTALGSLGDAVSLTFLEGQVTRSTIRDALGTGEYHVLHFIGHGVFADGEGHLILNAAHDATTPDYVSGHVVGGFFQDYPWMKLVVLNACQGAQVSAVQPLAGVAPQLVRRGVPAVVAMQYPVEDRAAVLFAREFYRRLCTGRARGRVDAAVSHARNCLEADHHGTLAFATPVLFMRSSQAGVIFDLERADRRRPLVDTAEDVDRLKAVCQTYEGDTALLEQMASVDAGALIAQNELRVAAIARRIRAHYAGIVLLVAAPVLLASWVSLFNAPFFLRLDDRLEFALVRAMDSLAPPEFSREIALVLADEDGANGGLGPTSIDWRCHHAALIDGLSAAGAAVVALDLYFEQGSPSCDPVFSEAVTMARSRGTAVVAGVQRVDWVQGLAAPAIAERLRGAIGDGWGLLTGAPGERKLPLAQLAPNAASGMLDQREVGVAPSFSLRTAMAMLSTQHGLVLASFNASSRLLSLRDENRALVASIPVVDRYLSTIVDVPDASRLRGQEHPYHEVLSGAADPVSLTTPFQNRIVVVGYRRSGDRWDVGLDEPLYGVHLQASAISDLIEANYVRPLAGGWHVLIIVSMASIAVLLRTRLRRLARAGIQLHLPWLSNSVEISAALLMVLLAYGALVTWLYWLDRIVLDISYHVFALIFTYWLLGRFRYGVRAARA